MKKKLSLLQLVMGSVLTVFLAGLVCCGMTSCKNTTLPWNSKTPAIEETVDSLVHLAVAEAYNPVFESADQAVVYRDLTLDGKSVDSVFNIMSDKTLIDVATVCIKRLGNVTKKEIVNEYLSHKDIYNSLPKDNAEQSSTELEKQASMEDSGVRKENKHDVISTSYRYHTDTVDGKPIKVQIKEEKSYVK